MAQSRNIFIQVDTAKIIKLATTAPIPTQPIKVREYSRLYDQGSMVIGDSITAYDVSVDYEEEDIQFAILPRHLYSFDKLYFTQYGPDRGTPGPAPIKLSNEVSFRLADDFKIQPEPISLILYATLEYGNGKTIQISIDPILKAEPIPMDTIR